MLVRTHNKLQCYVFYQSAVLTLHAQLQDESMRGLGFYAGA